VTTVGIEMASAGLTRILTTGFNDGEEDERKCTTPSEQTYRWISTGNIIRAYDKSTTGLIE